MYYPEFSTRLGNCQQGVQVTSRTLNLVQEWMKESMRVYTSVVAMRALTADSLVTYGLQPS